MESGGRFLFDDSGLHGNMLFLGNQDHVFQGARSMMMSMEDINTTKKRPFFCSSAADMYDEEYYDDQLPEKKRRLTPEQVNMLEKSFEAENKLEPERKTQLAKKLGLQPRQVAVWFQNRRARWKTKQLERDYDILKSSYDDLLANYDSVVKENEKLKLKVKFSSLTEELKSKEPAGLPISGQKSDITPAVSCPTVPKKVEDRLSSGSGRSAVVDEDSPQLVDSGNSCFPSDQDYPGCVVPIEGIHSEDDGSDDGHSYFPDVYGVPEQQQQDEGEPLGLWIWS